ncbi:transposase for insertion sequence element IS629 [Cardinium endosymbiont of Sogatella furcifera]|uniref:integrase core domain-containing protein n=1 Tax=Cardinium endosymbiont of Sogatella furcifera TaxID=650378 RepID=UPI000E103B6E|nr:integrase core domain-containing protein [Cardinium endosymbiont of Sogatella furcifera]AXI24637.1 transposase for insertion sequence element IS629 [Cardinium endosymbiont of Sogatella furcifera]
MKYRLLSIKMMNFAKALGKATVERDWVVGKLKSLDLLSKKSLVRSKLPNLPKARQCVLLSINRSLIYYKYNCNSDFLKKQIQFIGNTPNMVIDIYTINSAIITGIVKPLKNHNIKISMNGRGRSIDNIVMERFFRTLKYNCIIINDFKNIKALKAGINSYITKYNYQRFHSSINYQKPMNV